MDLQNKGYNEISYPRNYTPGDIVTVMCTKTRCIRFCGTFSIAQFYLHKCLRRKGILLFHFWKSRFFWIKLKNTRKTLFEIIRLAAFAFQRDNTLYATVACGSQWKRKDFPASEGIHWNYAPRIKFYSSEATCASHHSFLSFFFLSSVGAHRCGERDAHIVCAAIVTVSTALLTAQACAAATVRLLESPPVHTIRESGYLARKFGDLTKGIDQCFHYEKV